MDLALIANTWVNDLGQSPVTEAEADAQGYVGQFRTDLLAAFANVGADFNKDTNVNATDLRTWAENFGLAATGTSGDANGNGLADGYDFLLWQRQFTDTGPVSVPGTAAPEPSAIVLAMWGSALILFGQRKVVSCVGGGRQINKR